MQKFIVSIFIVFSLLLAPIAQADGMICVDDNGKNFAKVEIQKDSSQDSKQSGDETEKSAHCCHSHIVSDLTPSTMLESAIATSEVVIHIENTLSSLVNDPALEPPSYA